jgi:ribosome recycling factor
MQKAVAHLADQLRGLRAGELSPGFVETFRVAIDGQSHPLNRLAAVTRQGPRIVVRPFDRSHAPAIARALADGKLAAYLADPATVAVGVPPLSGEQREQMTKQIRSLGESARVAVRQIRNDVRKAIAARGHVPERAIQADTDAAIAEIDRLVEAKVKELAN